MEYIDCRQCEQHMNSFIANDLVGETLWQFLTHVEKCPECFEELEIRYLMAEALDRIENGEGINLRNELKRKIRVTKKAMYFHYFIEDILRIVEIMSMIVIVYEMYGFVSRLFGITF